MRTPRPNAVCFICKNTGVATAILSWSNIPNGLGSAICPCPHGDKYRSKHITYIDADGNEWNGGREE